MGIGSRLKGTFSSDDHGGRRAVSNPNYIPPSGTHVGRTGTSGDIGRDDNLARRSYEEYAAEERVPDRHVMDPADTKAGSNVMDTTGAAGDPETNATTGSSIGSGTGIDDHHRTRHSREDSDMYGDNRTGTAVTTGSRGIFSSDTPRQRNDHGRDSTGYSRDTSGTYGADPRTGESTTARRSLEGGVYNTVIGAGSHEDNTLRHQTHDQTTTTTTTSVGTRSLPHRPHEQPPQATSTARDSLTQPHDTGRLSGSGPAPGYAAGASIDEAGHRYEPTQSDLHRKPVGSGLASSGVYEPPRGTAVGLPTTHDVSDPYIATAGPLPPHNHPQAPPQPVLSSTAGQALGGPSHYGPGFQGAKVMHRCTSCGHDNDISHYFSREAVYRIG